MYEENLHITPDPKKGFPQPEIPADEAWNKMAELLDTEMPVSPPDASAPPRPPSPAAGGGMLGGSSLFWSVFLGVLGLIGILTWIVLNPTNKPETSALINDTINVVQNSTVTDSLTAVYQNNSFPPGNALSPRKNNGQDEIKNMPESRSASDNSIPSGVVYQPGVISQPVSETIIEKEPNAAAVTASHEQFAVKPKAIEPNKSDTGNIITSVKEIPVQQPVIEDIAKDTAKFAEFQPAPLSPDSISVNPSNKQVPDTNAPSNPAGDGPPPGATETPSVPEKSRRSRGLSENLTWQTGIFGNIGQVVQNGRDPNIFYGGMVTGGLWNKKINAGIETGLGWEDYNDYGSVTDNIRITDSIPIDTLGNFQYLDTTRIRAYNYQYQYLQVPLFISKQVFSKGKFSLDIKTGPVIGIMISDRKTTDYTSGPEGGEILGTVNSDYSRLKISWQWQLAPQFRWNFNDRFSIAISPFGIFYLNNLYESNNRPANSPFGIGMYGGLIYKLK